MGARWGPVTRLCALAAACAFCAPVAARAETFTFTDATSGFGHEPGNGRWSEPGSWASGKAPSGGPVDIELPVSLCKSPFVGCPPTEDDLAGLEVGTLAIGNRIVLEQPEPLKPGELPHPPPPHEPPPATYSIHGTQPLRLRSGITVETTPEGEGEATEGAGVTDLAMPLVLSGPNTWVIGRERGGTRMLPMSGLELRGAVSGDEPLDVVLGQNDPFELVGGAEVGPVNVEHGSMSFVGDLNGRDREPVALHETDFQGIGSIGPLSVDGGWFTVGAHGFGGTLAVSGPVTFTARTKVEMEERAAVAGPPAKLEAASVELGNAMLAMAPPCVAPGTVLTLVNAPEGVSGVFTDASGNPIRTGYVVQPLRDGCAPGAPTPPFRIDYTSTAVTATALGEAPPASGQAPSQSPSVPSPSPPRSGVADYAAIAASSVHTDLAAASDARTLRRLLRHGAVGILLRAPAGARLAITWSETSGRHRHPSWVLDSVALTDVASPTSAVDVHLRRGSRTAAAGLRHLGVLVRVTLTAPGQAPLTLIRAVALR